jgi:hypothetical protein
MGQFHDGLKNGHGKWKKLSESGGEIIATYEGDYKNDKKCGKGVFKWASGNIYIGEYKDDEREGFGEMRWIDGSIYIGEWYRGI